MQAFTDVLDKSNWFLTILFVVYNWLQFLIFFEFTSLFGTIEFEIRMNLATEGSPIRRNWPRCRHKQNFVGYKVQK